MASDDSSGVRPAPPIVLRIKLRYDDVEVMVQRFATNVGKSGLFLPTKSLQPIGTEIKFELRLADDTPVLVGLGRVKLAQPPDPNNPKATFGMAIELMRVTPQSRALILRMLERRRELGLPELGLPTPADLDAARRAEAVNAPVRDVVSEPVPVPVPVPSTPSEAPAPPAPGEAPLAPAPGEVLLTSPRGPTGAMAVAKVLAVTPLAPEPPRRKRLAVSEVIESASGPVGSVVVAVPGLDDEVDLVAAIVRARTLAGGALDAELAALSEIAATPVEISIDAASAELARQFGGSAVLRDRNARWAPPPAIPASPVTSPSAVEDVPRRNTEEAPGPPRTSEPVSAQGHGQAPEPVPAQGHEQAVATAPEPAHGQDRDQGLGQALDGRPDVPLAAPATTLVPPADVASADVAPAAHDDEAREVRSFAPPNVDQIATEPNRRQSRPRMSRSSLGRGARARVRPEPHEVEPDQIADEVHQLSELDLEEVEHTEMGEVPIGPGAFAPRGDVGEPSAEDQARLAARLEAQLAEAEAEADDLGIAGAVGVPASRDSATAFGAPPPADAEPRDDQATEAPLEVEEFDDFEILAEADADDADLLLAHGEQEASRQLVIEERPPTIERGASELDFAARLDLDEESDMYFAVSGSEFAAATGRDAVQDEFADRHAHDGLHGIFEGDSRLPDLPLDSAGQALAAFEPGDESLDQTGDVPLGEPGDPEGLAPTRGVQPIFDPEASNSYTLAIVPDSDDLDLPPLARPAPVERRPPRPQPVASPPEPAMLRGSPPPSSFHDAPVEDSELENALGALDVSLDDLSIPGAVPEPPSHREPSKSHPNVVSRQAHQAPSSPAHGRQPGAPARAVRQTGSGRVAPGSGRTAVPRATTDDGLVIDFDEDDDR